MMIVSQPVITGFQNDYNYHQAVLIRTLEIMSTISAATYSKAEMSQYQYAGYHHSSIRVSQARRIWYRIHR